ncbi:MAG: tRNA pseudouridine(13) synthase TruD [Candidatus Hodarchaeota archaeon]
MDHFSYEKLVGIRHYITRGIEGIGGAIKTTISDFIVQEITENKDIVTTLDDRSEELESNRKPSRNGRKYTKFVLKKFGVDTIYAIEYIAKLLGIPSANFEFAGIKDNRAITAQEVTIQGDYWDQLASISKDLPKFEIKSIDYSSESLKTGQLWGNNFIITIRDIQLEKKECEQRIMDILGDLVEKGGFLNYFGLQRFGTHRPNSQKIGKEILAGNYEGAVNQLLIPHFPEETPDAIKAREVYEETRDPRKTLEILPPSLYYETIILEYLADHPMDFKGALLALPPQIISIYVYSYQSFIFNEMISKRMEVLGTGLTSPEIGDMVALLDQKHGLMTKVRYVVKEGNKESLEDYIKLGKASIVIPIPGSRIKINNDNPNKAIHDEIIVNEQIDKKYYQEREGSIFHELHGIIRPLALFPRNCKVIDVFDDDLNMGKTAARISFSLSKGTYATMFLRELMKIKPKNS